MGAYLSAREAADYCGVSEKTIRNWIASGRLSAERSACAFRIAQEDLATLRRGTPRTPQEERGEDSASADRSAEVRAEGPRTESAAGIAELVALLREREAKIDDLSTQLVGYAESAAMWQARARVLDERVRMLEAPKPEPAPEPEPFPQPIPPTPNAAPFEDRWQTRAAVAAAVLLALVVATLAPAWVR